VWRSRVAQIMKSEWWEPDSLQDRSEIALQNMIAAHRPAARR